MRALAVPAVLLLRLLGVVPCAHLHACVIPSNEGGHAATAGGEQGLLDSL